MASKEENSLLDSLLSDMKSGKITGKGPPKQRTKLEKKKSHPAKVKRNEKRRAAYEEKHGKPWEHKSGLKWNPPAEPNPNLDYPLKDPEDPMSFTYEPFFTKDGVKRCGAKVHSHGFPCRNIPLENGRCRRHGGCSLPHGKTPRGEASPQFKHGAHERILFSTLNDEEVEMFQTMQLGLMENIDLTLKVLSIREGRMLERIQLLKETGQFSTTSVVHEKGTGAKGPVDLKTRKKEGTLGQIQAIEDALTKVQEKKMRLLELKHKVESSKGSSDMPNIDKFFNALAKTAEEVWGDQQ